MIFKTTLALAMLAAAASPSLAQDAMKPAGAMAHDDAMMAAPMKPMSKADKAMMMKCSKMTPAAAAKNARCAKLKAMAPMGHM